MQKRAMAPHSSTLAWKIPWTEEPGGLQSMGSLRVGHNWASSLSLFTFRHWRRNGNPLQCSCLENPKDGGAWWAAVYGFSQSQTWLKWLSSSSSRKETDSLVDDLWRSMHTHEKIWSNLCDRFTQVQYAWERLDHWGIASWSWHTTGLHSQLPCS